MLQSCPTLCDSMDHGPPGSSVHGILQARTLDWTAISFSSDKAWSEVSEMKLPSRVQLLATPWTIAYQAPPSMGFSRQEYWSGWPFPSPYLYDDAYNVIREWIFKRINPTNSNENTKSFIHKVAKIIKSNNKECWQGSWPILEKLGKQLWRMKC